MTSESGQYPDYRLGQSRIGNVAVGVQCRMHDRAFSRIS
jgi:hypothetical protein